MRSLKTAGRLRSFTLAAAELFVSQAASSRQIRDLEALPGAPLFDRGHGRVTLTAEGARLLAALTPAFDEVARRLDEIPAQTRTRKVTVGSDPAFASGWLVPNLPDFQARFPETDVMTDADPRLIEWRGTRALSLHHRHRLAPDGGAQARPV